MLPFQKQREGSASLPVAVQVRESESDDGLEVAAQDILDAVQRRDAKAMAAALRAAFQMLELGPHDEAEHGE